MKASDPRDKIYGILSFSDDSRELGIVPDYSKPCEPLYIEVSKTLLQRGELRILSFCHFPKALRGLPSWTPDWSAPFERELIDQRQKVFCASGGSKQSPKFCVLPSGSHGLWISGIVVDQVLDTSWACPTKLDFPPIREFGEFISGLEDLIVRFIDSAKHHIYAPCIWRVPIANTEFSITKTGLSYSEATRASFDSYRAIHRYASASNNCQIEKRHFDSMKLYFDSFALFSRGRKPFITERSHLLGIGPSFLQKGDSVVIFLGARVPYVIREVEVGLFELVGEVYVHHVVKGQFMNTKPAPRNFLFR